jgi:hypothetical protein
VSTANVKNAELVLIVKTMKKILGVIPLGYVSLMLFIVKEMRTAKIIPILKFTVMGRQHSALKMIQMLKMGKPMQQILESLVSD